MAWILDAFHGTFHGRVLGLFALAFVVTLIAGAIGRCQALHRSPKQASRETGAAADASRMPDDPSVSAEGARDR